LPSGLLGTHLTVASEATLINDALVALKAGGGGGAINFYVVGAIDRFKENADASVNTRKKIRDRIRSVVNKHATV
jgi:hypothetical protein